MSTKTDLETLTINYLTQAQYDAEKESGTIDDDALYLTPSVASPSLMGDYIVEQGTTSTGSYRKWSSGILECWLRTTQTLAINSAYGSMYINNYVWTFPAAFISTPTVTCSEFHWGSSASWGTIAAAGATSATLRGVDSFSRASGSTTISAYAIGRWK